MLTEPKGPSTPPFEVVDHTADIGIIAYGRNFPELLENAALGMMSLMVDLENVQNQETRPIIIGIPFPEKELLLLKWLKEIHYLFESEKFVTLSAKVTDWSETSVTGFVQGERLRPEIALLHHVKAVTHHLLQLEEQDFGLKAQIIFDV
ncbi:MAG: archease [Armatimonadetes bacterium]|nr:archease [Armatimonadota bacterium]MDW8122782.1 archease [Armatimonadota bacterium]